MPAQLSRRDFLKISSATILGAGLAGIGLNRLQERLEPSQVFAQGAQESDINVLWIVLDTVRASSLSLYGYYRATSPNLERLAQLGANFAKAIAPASWTLQSHASMFTGRYPFDLSAEWDVPLDNTYLTLAEVFRHSGYETAGFVANYYFLSPSFGINRGFDHYESFRLTPGRAFRSTAIGEEAYSKWRFFDKIEKNNSFGNKNAEILRIEFLRWLDRRSQTKPYFAFMNFIDAHAPYLPPARYVSRFTDDKPIANIPAKAELRKDPDLIHGLQDAYDGEIAYLDEQIGKLYDELAQRGQANNTLLVISSDHGEHFGEHGLLDHGTSNYLPLLHVPLLLICPGKIPKSVIRKPVAIRNVAATLIDVAKVIPAGAFPGQTLAPYWSNPDHPSELIRSETTLEVIRKNSTIAYMRSTSLVKDNFHYLHHQDGGEELYDLDHDLGENENLTNDLSRIPDLEYFQTAFKDRSYD